MLSIKDLNLKPFVLGDIFKIKNSKSIDRNKLQQGDGKIPYITQTGLNGGIAKFVCNQGVEKLNSGNVITVCIDTHEVFYQPCNYYSTQNVMRLECSQLNNYKAAFVVVILRQILEQRFNYSYKSTLKRISKLEIPFPVTSSGNPDWDMMETYIKDQMVRIKQQEKEELKKKIEKLEARILPKPNIPRPTIVGKATSDFRIDQIFDVKMSKSINNNKLNSTPGNIPYITRTGLNNGILKFVCEQGIEKLNPGNVITIGVDTQTVFYQKQAFYCGNNVLSLSSENVDQYIGIFIVGILDQIVKKKYNYGYGATLTRIKNLGIPLPITLDGKPDWEFMSDYIKTQSQIVFEEELKRLKSKLDE